MCNNSLKEIRKTKRMTQVELADALGVSHSAVQKIESGVVDLDLTWMSRLSKALNVKPYELLPKEWQPLTIDDICLVLTMVEEGLQAKNINMQSQEKVNLIRTLLEVAAEEPANQNEINKTIDIFCRALSI